MTVQSAWERLAAASQDGPFAFPASSAGTQFPIGLATGAGIPTLADIVAMTDPNNGDGAKVLRVGVSWDAMSSGTNGTFDQTSGVDELVQNCCDQQVGLILQVGSGPTNAGKMFVHATLVAYAQFFTAVCARYNGTKFSDGNFVLSVSAGNEPNHTKWDDGTASGVPNTGKGAAYAEMVIRIYDPLFNDVKSITNCPPIEIAGLGGEGAAEGKKGIDSLTFVKQAYASITVAGHTFANGWKGQFDIFDMHPYSYPTLPSQDTTRGWANMLEIRKYMVQQGDTSPVALTELGDPTKPNNNSTYDAATALLLDAVQQAQSLGYIWAFCWFSWKNNTKVPDVRNDNYFGIRLSDGTPKGGTTKLGYQGTFKSLATGTTTSSGGGPPFKGCALPTALGLCIAGANNPGAANIGARPVNGGGHTVTPFKRGDVAWNTAQTSNPTGASAGQNDHVDDWSHLDDMLDAAHTNGYRLIATLDYSPSWAGGSGDGHNYPRDAPTVNTPLLGYRDYANYCWLVAAHAEARHPGVLIIEIWNEPQNGFLDPINVNNYIAMLATAYDAVKTGHIEGRTDRTAYPQVPVITGGTGAGPSVGSPNRHLNWCKSIIAAAPTKFDHMTIHAYSYPGTLFDVNGYDPGYNDIQGGASGKGIRFYLDKANRQDAQILSTETGVFIGSGGGTLQDAADNLTNSYAQWQAKAETYQLAVYCCYEQDDTGTDIFDTGGIYVKNSTYSGAAKVNGASVPVFLNAYLGVQAGDVDTTAPSVTIVDAPTAPVQGTFTIAISTSDLDDAGHVGTPASALDVGLYNGTNRLADIPYTPDGAQFGFDYLYSGDSTDGSWPDGTYTLKVDVLDAAGNVGHDTVTITIANGGTNLPTITGLSIDSGSTAGGDTVVIAGFGFKPGGVNASAVAVGGTPVASFTVNSDTQITCTTPAKTAGTYTFKVTTTQGKSLGVPNARFTFGATGTGPTVVSVNPDHGPADGSQATVVTVDSTTGVLTDGTGVQFDGVDSPFYAIVDGTTINAFPPPGTAGATVDVQVKNGSGLSGIVPADAYTYDGAATPPDITSVVPNSGGVAGGTAIQVFGAGFATATTVTVGGTSVAFTIVSDTEIDLTTPAHAAGTVKVKVTNDIGSSGADPDSKFTYSAGGGGGAPVVEDVTPAQGPSDGSQTTTITVDDTTGVLTPNGVKFGGVVSPFYAIQDATTIVAFPPPGTAGTTVDVTVENGSGVSAINSNDTYSYADTPVCAIHSITLEDGTVITAVTGTIVVKGIIRLVALCTSNVDQTLPQVQFWLGNDSPYGPTLLRDTNGSTNATPIGGHKYALRLDTTLDANGAENLHVAATDSHGTTGYA